MSKNLVDPEFKKREVAKRMRAGGESVGRRTN